MGRETDSSNDEDENLESVPAFLRRKGKRGFSSPALSETQGEGDDGTSAFDYFGSHHHAHRQRRQVHQAMALTAAKTPPLMHKNHLPAPALTPRRTSKLPPAAKLSALAHVGPQGRGGSCLASQDDSVPWISRDDSFDEFAWRGGPASTSNSFKQPR